MFGDGYLVIYIANSLIDRKSHLLLPQFPNKKIINKYKKKIASGATDVRKITRKKSCLSKLNKIHKTVPLYLVKCLLKQLTLE